jgi:ABC-type sulfate transport system permease component
MKENIEKTGMIVFIGVPLVLFLTVLSGILIYCCKKKPKAQEFGKKLKDKLVFDGLMNMMIISSLAFAVQAGFGRALNYDEVRPESAIF